MLNSGSGFCLWKNFALLLKTTFLLDHRSLFHDISATESRKKYMQWHVKERLNKMEKSRLFTFYNTHKRERQHALPTRFRPVWTLSYSINTASIQYTTKQDLYKCHTTQIHKKKSSEKKLNKKKLKKSNCHIWQHYTNSWVMGYISNAPRTFKYRSMPICIGKPEIHHSTFNSFN